MPTYEYECTKCKNTFEEEAPITAPARQRCPRCRGKVIRLVSGGSGIVFKGSGFYATDSRRRTTGGEKPPAETTPAAANDTKPAASDKPKS
jgi:putative FmdB family regulatory protein